MRIQMKSTIVDRITELKEIVDQQRVLINGINNAIEKENFSADEQQQKTIDYILEKGRSALKEIEKLEELNKKNR